MLYPNSWIHSSQKLQKNTYLCLKEMNLQWGMHIHLRVSILWWKSREVSMSTKWRPQKLNTGIDNAANSMNAFTELGNTLSGSYLYWQNPSHTLNAQIRTLLDWLNKYLSSYTQWDQICDAWKDDEKLCPKPQGLDYLSISI